MRISMEQGKGMTTKIIFFLKKEHSPYFVLATQHSKTNLYTKLRTQKRTREDVPMQSLRSILDCGPHPDLP